MSDACPEFFDWFGWIPGGVHVVKVFVEDSCSDGAVGVVEVG